MFMVDSCCYSRKISASTPSNVCLLQDRRIPRNARSGPYRVLFLTSYVIPLSVVKNTVNAINTGTIIPGKSLIFGEAKMSATTDKCRKKFYYYISLIYSLSFEGCI